MSEEQSIAAARQRRMGELFRDALEHPAEERIPFLTQACTDDKVMLDEVLALLRAHAPATDVLPETRETLLRPLASPTKSEATAGAMNSRYKLLQKIGEGGMGEVWLAEQKEPVRRRVAVKLVKAGMNSREVIARFESERQALALMDHPAIAKVLDAGATPDGMPYFVMEYVAGVPITNYCDNHKLGTRERLELFIHVCEGVQHAHQKAIIHRDLKPSNILVAEVDGSPAPKIIDFGVAKALSQKLTADTMFTRVGAIIGTPEYMSPEQANWSHEDIDTRSDIYSLGVIFYELLAGSPPINLQKIAYDEFLRRLRDEEPSKPSTKIRTQDPEASAAMALKRHTEPVTLAKQISGDLDAIALKTLEKDRSRRYGTASDFAADIGRYLRNEPVLAVAPSAAYRARKFASRYRGQLITVCAFILMLILAATISIWESIRVTKERDRADAAAAEAQAVNDFLRNDLLAPDSATGQYSAKPDPDLKVRTVLERAAKRIAGKFARQPGVEAATRFTIGTSYWQLGVYPEAQKQLERALELRRRTLGVEHPDTLKTINMLGVALADQDKRGEAEALFNQLVEVRRRVLGPEHPDTLTAMSNLGNMYDAGGKYTEAEGLDSKLLEIRRRVLGPEHSDTLDSMNNLALDYSKEGKFDEAEALQRKILEIRRRLLGPEHPATLLTMFNLAGADDSIGKFEEAETLINKVLEVRKRTLPQDHPYTVNTLEVLAFTNYLQGKYAQAETLGQGVVDVRRRSLGPEHPETLTSMAHLGRTYSMQGKYTEAEGLFNRTLQIRRRVLGPRHPETFNSVSDLAFMYQRQGKFALAETFAGQALAGKREVLGTQQLLTMETAADLALARLSQGKAAESEPLAREALDFFRKRKLNDWQLFRAESLLGGSLAGQKKYAEAEPLLVKGYEGMLARKDRIPVPNLYHMDRAREWALQLYQAWGKPEKVAEWRMKMPAQRR